MDSSTDRMNRALTGTTSRRQALKLLGGGLVGGALAGAGFATLNNAAAQTGTGGLPVTGVVNEDGTFTGTLSNLDAFVRRGQINISGTLSGVVEGIDGVGDIVADFTTVLEGIFGDQQNCQILFLDLGPIFLDVLGLQIDLSQIVLDVTAVPGQGNLLGNLLCAIAGLLDRPGQRLGQLVNLLNQVFALLG